MVAVTPSRAAVNVDRRTGGQRLPVSALLTRYVWIDLPDVLTIEREVRATSADASYLGTCP